MNGLFFGETNTRNSCYLPRKKNAIRIIANKKKRKPMKVLAE